MEAVQYGLVPKITSLLDKGLDPNFQSKNSSFGETPLTLAVQGKDSRNLVIELVKGGALLDYRASDSMTPLHKAAIVGNYEGIQALLDLGQNPNCKDWRGLTPLYHCVAVDSPAKCSQSLLYDHAIIGIQDDMGLQEIHQACRFGRTQHLENLIQYGADLNSRTKKGNTPMHICVVADQENCLRLLLIRGADPSLINTSGQTPLQCALLTGRSKMTDILENFNSESVIPIRDIPVYNESRRATVNGPRGAVNGSMNSDYKFSLKNHNIVQQPRNGFSNNSNRQSYGESTISSVENYQWQKSINIISSETEKSPLGSKNNSSTYAGRTYEGVVKSTIVYPGVKGFGFVLRGARNFLSETRQSYYPTQYVTSVQHDGSAYRSGLRSGDYILEINGIDISESIHDDAVKIIRNFLRNPLEIKYLTPYSLLRRVERELPSPPAEVIISPKVVPCPNVWSPLQLKTSLNDLNYDKQTL